ncbi:MAG: glycosyltransferase family 39 protein [Chlamydiales bacterium]|nr:glycosyltransferase family 39 protein [Chlamydiia bacterium]MCP5508739.1 glycosyltransferase family 39 protein [Chlamydiales bacterium]
MKGQYLLCFTAAFVVACLWAFAIFPFVAGVQDSDHWGALGRGLYQFGTLSYYPDPQPTIQRGPGYPLFIAFTLLISGGWWPYAVQLGQCVLLALASATTCWIGTKLFNRGVGATAGLIVAVHPMLFWYVGRIWAESLLIFLTTAFVASLIAYDRRPSWYLASISGLILGACVLTKATFLPFIALVPLYFWWMKQPRCWMICLVALCVVTPWGYRNWQLTRSIVPVHALAGYNMQRGDDFTDEINAAPFSYGRLWEISNEKNKFFRDPDAMKFDKRWEYELWFDQTTTRLSVHRYLHHPFFLLKKMTVNALAFWFLGDTPLKTCAFIVMQGLLLFFFVRNVGGVLREHSWRSIYGLLLMFIAVYYFLHLPIFAFARLSAVLIPTMLSFAIKGSR